VIPTTFPGYKVTASVMESPNNFQLANAPFCVFDTLIDNGQPGNQIHFQVQISFNGTFTAVVEEGKSWVTPNLFQYEISPGVWSAFPSTGLTFSDLGKRVRYQSQTVAQGTYFWRMRVEDFV